MSAVPAPGTTDSSENGEVLGAEDTLAQNAANQEDSANGFKPFGIDWYWILGALLGLAFLWWLIAAYRRRKDNE